MVRQILERGRPSPMSPPGSASRPTACTSGSIRSSSIGASSSVPSSSRLRLSSSSSVRGSVAPRRSETSGSRRRDTSRARCRVKCCLIAGNEGYPSVKSPRRLFDATRAGFYALICDRDPNRVPEDKFLLRAAVHGVVTGSRGIHVFQSEPRTAFLSPTEPRARHRSPDSRQ